MRIKNVLLIFLLLALKSFAQNKHETTVFKSGTEGYKSFRIPAIIQLPNKEILAFCEGRVGGAGDYGNIDLVMKRSTDKGKTWSALQVVAEFGNEQISNPAPVMDLTDPAFPNGKLFLFYNTGNRSESEILKGNGIKRCMYKTSTDDGQSWSEPVDITDQAHRLKKPDIDAAFNFSEDWRYHANTPGHAIQVSSGKYKGRIFIAANHSAGDPQKGAGHYVAHGYYTDDHGKTFSIGNSLNLPGSNESMATELSHNRIMMNSRNQRGDVRARIVSISSNGGATWDTTYFDQNLPDPVCQGSILTIGKKKGKNIIAFCNAADTKERNNLTLRISFDEGQTWEKNIPIYKGDTASNPKHDFSAYSDLVKIDGGHIGVLYERDNYGSISFIVEKWK